MRTLSPVKSPYVYLPSVPVRESIRSMPHDGGLFWTEARRPLLLLLPPPEEDGERSSSLRRRSPTSSGASGNSRPSGSLTAQSASTLMTCEATEAE